VWLLFDKHFENNKHVLTDKGEISKTEIDDLFGLFSFCAPYTTVKMMESIVLRNGLAFQQHMSPSNLLKYRQNDDYDAAIETANQLVFNYAASIKSFIDITEATLKESRSEDQLELYRSYQTSFYDNQVEYRFWMRLRNFIIHRGFPYTRVHDSAKAGVQVLCEKSHLLTFSGWNTVKPDLLQMDRYVDMHDMVKSMNTCIQALRLAFIGLYANDILNAISGYGAFCRKHGIKEPMFTEVDSIQSFSPEKAAFTPIPLDELRQAFEDIRRVPFVEIQITD